jgi:hypothetical protein
MSDELAIRIHEKLRKASLRLEPPLCDEEVAAFEARHGVVLPVEYRYFITRCGNGGAGPWYGLLPLAKWAYGVDDREITESYLATPSHFGTAADDSSRPYRQGTIALAEEGCGFLSVLVVSGVSSGRVVGTDGGFTAPFYYAAPNFLAWYESWLDATIGIAHDGPIPWQFKLSGDSSLALDAAAARYRHRSTKRPWWQFWR